MFAFLLATYYPREKSLWENLRRMETLRIDRATARSIGRGLKFSRYERTSEVNKWLITSELSALFLQAGNLPGGIMENNALPLANQSACYVGYKKSNI